jgi:hypothetical protein
MIPHGIRCLVRNAALVLGMLWPGLTSMLPADAGSITLDNKLLSTSKAEIAETLTQYLQPTMVHWPAGICSAQTAIDRLAATGNATALSSNVNAADSAILPAFSGHYWNAVQMVCDAFGLDLVPSCCPLPYQQRMPSMPFILNDPVMIPVHAGPLLLTKHTVSRSSIAGYAHGSVLWQVLDCRARDGLQVFGADAIGLEWSQAIRFEPHIDADRITYCMVHWDACDDGEGRPITTADTAHVLHGAAGSTSLGPLPSSWLASHTLHCRGTVQVWQAEPWTVTATLTRGEKVHQALVGTCIAVALADNANTTPATCTLSVILSQQLPASDITVTSAGRELTRLSQSWSLQADGNYTSELVVALPAQASCVVTIGGTYCPAPQIVPVQTLIAFGNLAVHAARVPHLGEEDCPTLLSWPAGTLPLHDAIARLRGHGNSVALAADVDGAQVAVFGEFHGCFWQAVHAVCAGYHLAMRDAQTPTSSTANRADGEPPSLVGGPLILGAQTGPGDRNDSDQVCGPALIQVTHVREATLRSLTGEIHEMHLTFQVRLEPHIDTTGFTSGRIMLPSVVPGRSRDALVLCSRSGRKLPQASAMFPLNQIPNQVTVSGPADGAAVRVITGQLVLLLHDHLQTDITLRGGEHRYVNIGGHLLKVSRHGPDPASGPKEQILDVDMVPMGLSNITVSALDMHGTPMSASSCSANNQSRHLHWLNAIPETAVVFRISLDLNRGMLEIPLTIAIPRCDPELRP